MTSDDNAEEERKPAAATIKFRATRGRQSWIGYEIAVSSDATPEDLERVKRMAIELRDFAVAEISTRNDRATVSMETPEARELCRGGCGKVVAAGQMCNDCATAATREELTSHG